MTTNNLRKNENGLTPSIIVAVFVSATLAVELVMIIPVPFMILNILITMNVILAASILFMAILSGDQYRKNAKAGMAAFGKPGPVSILPSMFLISSIFTLMLKVASTRLFLIQGSGFDGGMTRAISDLISTGGTAGLIAGFCILMVICTIVVSVIKGSRRIVGVTIQFVQDATPGIIMAIEDRYNRGDIRKREYITQKYSLLRRNDFLGAVDGAGKFITGSVNVTLFFMAVDVLGGIIIGTMLHGQTIQKAAETSIAFGIGGIIFLLTLLLLSISTGIVSRNVDLPGIRQ
jgi:flagellar biosynthesis protein FlhA